MCSGNLDQNTDYCGKDGDFREFGEKPIQGKRADLISIKDLIMSGEKSVNQICESTPEIYHQYGRTLNKLEDIHFRSKYRTWMTEGIWIHGPTGCGKSHQAFEGYTPETHYVLPEDSGWWDGYTGQETIIINEFRGSIKYSELLDLCDKWPKTVKRRNREPAPFLGKKIIITSSLSPEQVYCNIACSDSLDQLYRRFEILEIMAQKCSKGNTETLEPKIDEIF
jgi:hypothetical protein